MTTWKFTTVAALASLMVAGPAFAQATADSPKTDATKTDSMKADGAKADKKPGAMRGARMGGTAMGDEQVKAAQQALKDKGHDPGTVDGKMGPKTQAALRDFQKAQGIEASGRLDTKTTQALGMDGKMSGTGSSSTSGSASPATSGTTDATKSDATKSAPKSEEKK
jgi:peptidoglycan hydrolase-like protein with peptidoglycan-binding domain